MAASGTGLTGGLNTLFGGGGGILSNMLSGAIKSGLTGALIGGVAGAAMGGDWKKGAMIGGLGGAAMGGLGGLRTPTGMGVDPLTTGSVGAADTPTGAAAKFGGAPIPDNLFSNAAGGGINPASAGGAVAGLKGFGNALGFGEGGFFRSEGGAGALAGLGAAAGDIYAAKAAEESAQADRDAVRAQEKRRTNSYKIDPTVLAGNTPLDDPTYRPTPAMSWAYNPSSGMIERGA